MASQVFGALKKTLNGRYEIQQQLGKKAGRQTLLARDLETQELVVVKLLSFGNDFEWDSLKLFEREVETLKALDHPAIPRYLDYIEINLVNGKGFALVQTYIKAKSLEEHLKAGRTFSEQEIRQLAKALLEILIYLHERQPPVIHRDIKPSNVLLGVSEACAERVRSGNSVGEVYLVDFGSVQTLAARECGTYTVVGTYGYMPPEQFGGRTVPASDLYSLGATLIALVTGAYPADLPQKDGQIQFEQVANISPEFLSWLRWMTELSLDQRLASASAALQALERKLYREIAPFTRQPPDSRILLTKKDSLEILIPPEGLSAGVFAWCLIAIAYNTFILLGTGAAISTSFFFAFVLLPLWVGGISMILYILFTLFGQVRLRLNQEQIGLIYELFGCQYNHPRPARRQDIWKLEYTKSSLAKAFNGYLVEIKPRVIISAGIRKYELGGNILPSKVITKNSILDLGGSRFSEAELEWLAYELSDWLDLPIIRA